MARVKTGKTNHQRHVKVLKLAKGYFGGKHCLYKSAHEQVMHSGKYAYNDRRKNKSFPVKSKRQGVRDAKLLYKVLSYNEEKDLSLVAVRPITGRTHQIRVQFAARKHPLAGDGKYGSRIKCNVSLFASVLELSDDNERFFEKTPSCFPWDVFEEELRDSVKDLSL